MRAKSQRPGTDPRGEILEKKPLRKSVDRRRTCEALGCNNAKLPGRGQHYCQAHRDEAQRARPERLRESKRRFKERHGAEEIAVRDRMAKRLSRIRTGAPPVRQLETWSSSFGPRPIGVHIDDVEDRIDWMRSRILREGPTQHLRFVINDLHADIRASLPKGKERNRLLARNCELLVHLGDWDPSVQQRRVRALESYYASVRGPERYVGLAWLWVVEADTWRKHGRRDLADVFFKHAHEAVEMLREQPPTLRHVIAKQMLRIAFPNAAAGVRDPFVQRLLGDLEETSDRLGSAFYERELARELHAMHTIMKRFDAAAYWLERVHALSRQIEERPFSEPTILRAEIEFRIDIRDLDSLPPLLRRYRELCEYYQDRFRMELIRKWAQRLGRDRDVIGPVPSGSWVHIPCLYDALL